MKQIQKVEKENTIHENSQLIPDLSNYNKNSDYIFIQSINFENKKIVDINYDFEVMEIVKSLLKEMKELKEKVNLLDDNLKKGREVLFVQGTLKSMWEEDGDAWDNL